MDHKKIDRRVKYTQALLKSALTGLLRENHISKISVTAICDSAEVNRSTFYAHYTDQFDLFAKLKAELMQDLQKLLQGSGSAAGELMQNRLFAPRRESEIVLIFDYAKENAGFFIAMLGDMDDLQMAAFARELSLIPRFSETREEEYLSIYVATGAASVLLKWLRDGMQESSEEMARLVLNLIS